MEDVVGEEGAASVLRDIDLYKNNVELDDPELLGTQNS